MPHLKTIDQRILEDYFQMGGGYVLDFTNQSFQQAIFDFCEVDIYSEEYAEFGGSKGKRLRCFFAKSSKENISKVVTGLYEYAKACVSDRDISKEDAVKQIIARLKGSPPPEKRNVEQAFLEKNFSNVDFASLSLEPSLVEVLNLRWKEVGYCRNAKAYLSAVIMTGSLLEAILLGVASRNPSEFNQSKSTPKDEDGKPRQFHTWSLASLIDVAFETNWIHLDVKMHCHSLRDFRNYIHPYQQKLSCFQPTQETLAISIQVFRAAITQIKNKI